MEVSKLQCIDSISSMAVPLIQVFLYWTFFKNLVKKPDRVVQNTHSSGKKQELCFGHQNDFLGKKMCDRSVKYNITISLPHFYCELQSKIHELMNVGSKITGPWMVNRPGSGTDIHWFIDNSWMCLLCVNMNPTMISGQIIASFLSFIFDERGKRKRRKCGVKRPR